MAFCKHISLNLYVFEDRNPGFGWRALTIWFAECHSVKMVICNPLRIPRFKEIGRSVVHLSYFLYPGIPTTIKTIGVDISTIAYLRVLVLIIEIGSTIILMVVEAQGISSMVHGGLSRLWFRDWSSCAGRRGTQDFHCSGLYGCFQK